jgi:hypothetical protein
MAIARVANTNQRLPGLIYHATRFSRHKTDRIVYSGQSPLMIDCLAVTP